MKHKPLKNSKSIWGQLELIHTTYNDDILSALYRKFPDLIYKYTYLAKIPIYTAVVVVISNWKKSEEKWFTYPILFRQVQDKLHGEFEHLPLHFGKGYTKRLPSLFLATMLFQDREILWHLPYRHLTAIV